MRRRLAAVVFLFVLALLPRSGHTQCPKWIAGPLEGPNGADAAVLAFTSWDPDGGGPQSSWLVAAGAFGTMQGVPTSRVAARDPVTGDWQSLGSPAFPALAVFALALATYNGDLIAGGSFVALGGSTVNRIARWNGTAWESIGPAWTTARSGRWRSTTAS